MRWRVQGAFSFSTLDMWWSGNSSTEHLPPLYPATLWESNHKTLLWALTRHNVSFFSHLLFFGEVGCPFFTFGVVIYFLQQFYISYVMLITRSVSIYFSPLYPVGYSWVLGRTSVPQLHTPESAEFLFYQNN